MEEKTLLQEEIRAELEAIGDLNFEDGDFKTGIDSVTKLMDRQIEIERMHLEAEEKARAREAEYELKQQQMVEERKDRWFRHGIAIGGIVVPVIVTVWGTLKTLKFEETGTVTTMMGRGFINKLLPKK